MANTIKGFIVSGTPRYIDAISVNGHEIAEESLAKLDSGVLNSMYVNAKNNLELSAAAVGAEKLNLVAGGAVQIKPGVDENGKGEAIQLDCERYGDAATELSVKVCNGAQPNGTRVVGLKVNAAELVLDNQKGNTTEFDADSFDIKVRNDKWNSGQQVGTTGPIYLKAKARAFDFRCYDHGGIALQVAGADSHGNENKIKFESDRTTEPGATATYCGEGGKGLEFGTFNNLHTSLYTGDYRFKGDAKVYGVTRNTPVATPSTGKIDYPTQSDDFKDVINATTPSASWNEILDAANKCKNLEDTVNAAVARAALSGEGIDTSVFVTRDEVEDVVASAMTDMHIDTTGLASEQWVLDKHYIDADANEIVFEKKVSKNGDRSGQDTEFVYSYSNNVSDPEKVADFAAFKANYDNKHKNHGKSDEELQAMYDAFLAEGTTYEVRVKVSELLGLVSRVAALEAKVAELESKQGE